jgi:ribose transport system ATP-binding protein
MASATQAPRQVTEAPRLVARGIVKRFHGNVALDGVDFDLRRGEVHGLVGENGAGKSTLIKILTGVQPPDEGEIVYEGRKVAFASPNEAQRAGVTAIYQEINLAPNLSAAENIFIGNEPLTRLRTVDWRRMREQAKALLERYGIDVDFRRPVGELGLAAQQMVAIVRALSQNGQTIVMDEPTSSLTHREVDRLLDTIGQVAATGASVIYISHRLDELFRVAHRVTVLRDGRRILTEAMTSLTRGALVEAMLGRADIRQLDAVRDARPAVERTGALHVEGLSSAPRVAEASLAVKAGEIVGLAGLQGSGRTETMRTIFGADAKSSGEISIDGAPLDSPSPRTALARGLAYLPEDRKADGIVPGLSLRENLTLILLPRLSRFGLVSSARETALVDEFIRRLGIRAANADIPIRHLSGGNQQKVLIARLLCADPKYLLLDDPMRGIDIGAKGEIERLIVELSGMGLGVLMTSSELEEVIGVSDRIVVIRDGATRGGIARDEASFETVAAAIASDTAEPAR